jgi:hypothetical protein
MVGYNAQCKLCNCEQRAEAEQMREQGASLQQIVDFLAGHGVTLSKPAVKRHFDTHFAPKEEAARRYYEQSEAVMQQAVGKRLTDLEMLDATIERNYRLHIVAHDWIQDRLAKRGALYMDNKPMVDLLSSTSSELRQAIKLKQELLGEDPTTALADVMKALWTGGDDDELEPETEDAAE